MTSPWSLGAIFLVCAVTLALGWRGLGRARGTSDFYVAGRTVSPWRNASAIGGEYLSAASFLGVAGLVYERGVDMLWMPVGYTVGYLVLLALVAAPLRRSGAYTLPDFAEMRLGSRAVRLMSSALVVAIGWLYLLPQMQGAGLALRHVTGWPTWIGGAIITAIITANLAAGGMRSITLVQAVQYWLKLSAIALPAFILLYLWLRDGRPSPVADQSWWLPLTGSAPGQHEVFITYSTLAALCLGAMGLPHVVVRFYTNPDGWAARRTTVAVVALLGLFYLFPPVYGVLGRRYLEGGTVDGFSGSVVLSLPGAMIDGIGGDLLAALLAGGAFAAFLSTASGVAMSVAGALDQDVLRPLLTRRTGGDFAPVQSFRVAAVLGVLAPFVASGFIGTVGISTVIGHAFAIAAATFAPMLILGVWWRRLTAAGAGAGLAIGGITTAGAAILSLSPIDLGGWPGALLSSPTAWATPLAVAVAVGVSLLTSGSVPRNTPRIMARLHTPEEVLEATTHRV